MDKLFFAAMVIVNIVWLVLFGYLSITHGYLMSLLFAASPLIVLLVMFIFDRLTWKVL